MAFHGDMGVENPYINKYGSPEVWGREKFFKTGYFSSFFLLPPPTFGSRMSDSSPYPQPQLPNLTHTHHDRFKQQTVV